MSKKKKKPLSTQAEPQERETTHKHKQRRNYIDSKNKEAKGRKPHFISILTRPLTKTHGRNGERTQFQTKSEIRRYVLFSYWWFQICGFAPGLFVHESYLACNNNRSCSNLFIKFNHILGFMVFSASYINLLIICTPRYHFSLWVISTLVLSWF